jgi:hypothetical protein
MTGIVLVIQDNPFIATWVFIEEVPDYKKLSFSFCQIEINSVIFVI